jgi:hypothetical protein
MCYRYASTHYIIHVTQTASADQAGTAISCDGLPAPDGRIPLLDDGQEHTVDVAIQRADPVTMEPDAPA